MRTRPVPETAIFGIDSGKKVFHIVALNAAGGIVQRTKFSRDMLMTFFDAAPRALVGMDDLTLRSAVEITGAPESATFAVSAANPEVVASIVRMVTAHATTTDDQAGWRCQVATSDIGAVMTVTGDAAQIRALGFIRVMTVGMHHQTHHRALATGAAPHD